MSKQQNTNGKGDKSRVKNLEQYRKNFDKIKWSKKDK
jgi:hypothetical protein